MPLLHKSEHNTFWRLVAVLFLWTIHLLACLLAYVLCWSPIEAGFVLSPQSLAYNKMQTWGSWLEQPSVRRSVAWQLHNTTLCPRPTGMPWRERNAFVEKLVPFLVLGPLGGSSHQKEVGVLFVGRRLLTTTLCWDTSGSVKEHGW